jgi:hypothetical protein
MLVSTQLALPRQRLASEADNLEAGDVGHLRTVGGLEEDPNQSGAFPCEETADATRVWSYARSSMYASS